MLDVLLLWSAAAVGGLSLLMFLDILVQRLRYQSHQRWLERRHVELLPIFYKYICEDINVMELVRHAGGRSSQVSQDIILYFLRELEGLGRERLIEAAFDLRLIERALRGLHSPDWTERELACMRLGRYALDDTVPDLARMLRDRQVQVRYTAARSLGLIGTPAAEDALVDILDKPELIDTPRILEIVQTMPTKGSKPLERLLSGEHHPIEAKLLAIDLVGDLRMYNLSTLLLEILNSSSKEKVLRAIKALGKLSAPDSISALLTMVNNRPWEIRAQALKALGMLQVEESIPLMVHALSDESYWVRKNAAEGLSLVGPSGIRALFDASGAKDMFARDTATYQLEQLNGKAHSFLEAEEVHVAPSPRIVQMVPGGQPA